MINELWIASKYFRAKRKQAAISIVTFLSIAGVAVGVMALIIVISVMSGFAENLKEKILGIAPHVMVFQTDQEMTGYESVRRTLLKTPGVLEVGPFIMREVILQGSGKSVGAIVKAIDPELAASMFSLKRFIPAGDLAELGPKRPGKHPRIILGKGLMERLGLKVGDRVVLVSPEGTLTPWGNLPKWKKFEVVGYFDSGYWEFDVRLALISIADAQRVFEMPGRVTGLDVKVRDFYKAPEIRRRIQEGLLGPRYVAVDWMQRNRNLMIALGMQKKVMFVILSCIVGVAALLIISILVMMVMEKKKDIGILKSMGARPLQVMRIFLFQGMIIGAIGVLLGCAGGVLTAWNLERIVGSLERIFDVRFLPGDVYYISELTSRVEPLDLAVIIGVTLLISLLASLYPSWKASRLDPVEGIRYE